MKRNVTYGEISTEEAFAIADALEYHFNAVKKVAARDKKLKPSEKSIMIASAQYLADFAEILRTCLIINIKGK